MRWLITAAASAATVASLMHLEAVQAPIGAWMARRKAGGSDAAAHVIGIAAELATKGA